MWSPAVAAPRRGTKPGGAEFSYVKPPPVGARHTQQLEGGSSCRTANATRKPGLEKNSPSRSSAVTYRTKARSTTPKLPSKPAVKTTARRAKNPVDVLDMRR